jgi:hypothetical protein
MQAHAALAGKLQRLTGTDAAHVQQPVAQAGLSKKFTQEIHGAFRAGLILYD